MGTKSRVSSFILALIVLAGMALGTAVPANAEEIPASAKDLFQKIVGYGASPEVAAGLLGNAYQESGMNPSAIQGGGDPSIMTCNGPDSSTGGRAVGLFQWDSGRKNNLLCAAEDAGVAWTDTDFQLKFAFDIEMATDDPFTQAVYGANAARFCGEVTHLVDCGKVTSTGFPNGVKDFLKGNYPEGATLEFAGYWERPGIPHMERRVLMAKQVFDAYKDLEGTESGGEGEGEAGEPEVNESLPDSIEIPDLVKEEDLTGMGDQPTWDEVNAPEDATLESMGVGDQFRLSKAGDAIASEKKPALYTAQLAISMGGLLFLLWSIFIFACMMFDKANTVFEMSAVKLVTFGRMEYVEDVDDEGGISVGFGKVLVRCLTGLGVGLMLVSGVFFGIVERAFSIIASQ